MFLSWRKLLQNNWHKEKTSGMRMISEEEIEKNCSLWMSLRAVYLWYDHWADSLTSTCTYMLQVQGDEGSKNEEAGQRRSLTLC